MRPSLMALATAASLAIAAPAAHATEFKGSWSVTSGDPKIIIDPINQNFDFTLSPDDPSTFFKREDQKLMPLFNIYVDEKTLQAAEYTPSDISLTFTFDLPTPTDGDPVSGVTGVAGFISQSMYLDWDPGTSLFQLLNVNGGTSINYGKGSPRGLLDIGVNGGVFDAGLIGLPGPRCNRAGASDGSKGALTVYGLFDWVRDPTPTAGVPEPATWALMIGGFGMAGAALRRRRAAATTA